MGENGRIQIKAGDGKAPVPVVTLLTDFGLGDAYVGIMKGVILSVAPDARMVDITHQVSPQNLIQAAFLIDSATPYFPRGTLHMVVVDPGVGSRRRILALETDAYRFLAPDNGVLTRVLEKTAVRTVVAVENPDFFLPTVSGTFHGRDIFAPVAAHILRGVPLQRLGPGISPDTLVRLDLPAPRVSDAGEWIGTVIDMDRFGNLVTNLEAALLAVSGPQALAALTIHVGSGRIRGLSVSYAAVAPGEPLAVIGSRGTLEISVNQGSAADYFSTSLGDTVRVQVSGGQNRGKA
jgi:hypothetical protein